MDFVDDDDGASDEAEFVFGVDENQALGVGVGPTHLKERQGGFYDLVEVCGADAAAADQILQRTRLVVHAHGFFGRWRDDRAGQRRPRSRRGVHFDAVAVPPCFRWLAQQRSGQMAPYDELDGERLGFLAAQDGGVDAFEEVGRCDLSCAGEPVGTLLREQLALERDGAQDDVEGRDAVRCDQQDLLPFFKHVTHLAAVGGCVDGADGADGVG